LLEKERKGNIGHQHVSADVEGERERGREEGRKGGREGREGGRETQDLTSSDFANSTMMTHK